MNQNGNKTTGNSDHTINFASNKGKAITTKEDIEALRDGSYRAYDKIYLAWHKPIFNMLLHLTGSTAEAEDITQEVFIGLWEYREKLDPDKKINTFLYMVAKRASIDHFRRKRSSGQYLSSLDWDEISNTTSDGLLIEKEIELLKEMALSRMPEYRRKIYLLSHSEGLSNDQISEKLNITKESVYTQLSIARKQLREFIQLAIILMMIN